MKTKNVMTGVAIGVMTGVAAGMVGSAMLSKSTKKTVKKKAGSALKSMGNMIDTAQYMLK